MATEAEHVGPGTEPEVCQLTARAKGPGGTDHAPRMVRDPSLGQFGEEANRPVQGAGRRLGALGGVLRDVRGYGPLGQLLAAVEVSGSDGPDVELTPEGEGVGPAVDLRSVDACGGRSGTDGVGQQVGRCPGRGRVVAAFRAVEADDRVEVDGSTPLVFGDLGEGDAGVAAEGPLGEAGALGDLPAEVDREAPPEGTGVRVPENGRFVFVGVRVERGAEYGVLLVVVEAAAARAAVGTAVVDRAEAGGGERGEDARVGRDLLGGAFAAAQSGGDQVVGVAALGLGAGGTAGCAAVVAADEELTGGKGGGVQMAQDVADLAGGRVDGVLGAVAVEADGVGTATQAGELAGQLGHGAQRGQHGEFRQRGWSLPGDDGCSFRPFRWLRGTAPGRRDAWRRLPPRQPVSACWRC